MKKVELIPIAKKKARRRGIRAKWINDALRNPAQLVDGYGGRRVAQNKILVDNKEYLLRVVYEETEEAYVVITAYLTSQISRYWKEGE
jgi:hypothetical protein